MLTGPLRNKPVQLIVVLVATQAGGESLIFGPGWIPDNAAEPLPLLIIGDGDVYPAVNELDTACKFAFSVLATIAALDCAMVVAVP